MYSNYFVQKLLFVDCKKKCKVREKHNATVTLFFISFPQFNMIYFIYHKHSFSHGNIRTHNWPSPNVSGFIAQLVEHRTGNRKVTGSNPVEVLNFFQASLRNCIDCVHCDDHFFISFHFHSSIWFISYIINTHFFHWNIRTHDWLAQLTCSQCKLCSLRRSFLHFFSQFY